MTPSDGVQLDHLQTEERSAQAHSIDSLDTFGLCIAFNHEESRVSASVASCVPTIVSFVDILVPRLHAGGRLIYVGAGNSGRVALMDCAELPVTFSTREGQVIALVAGGEGTATKAQEGAEDAEQDGAAQLEALNITTKDTVLGISASGRTPFVLGALKVAVRTGALTASITNTSPSLMGGLSINYSIVALLGPEFVSGSTRLKAGSAAKQILNMISTCSMIKLGKTYRGLMIDLRVGNQKLEDRARRILRQVCDDILGIYSKKGLTLPSELLKTFQQMQNDHAANDLIRRCDGKLKLACAVALTNLSPHEANSRLQKINGDFGAFVADHLDLSHINLDTASLIGEDRSPEYFLSIDGGGTKCAVSIASRFGIVSRGYGGACNFNIASIEELVSQIKKATMEAIRHLPHNEYLRPGMTPRFSKVWAGIAGLHHADKLEVLTSHLEKLFGVSAEKGSLRLTSDSALLSACIEGYTSTRTCISLISGTGSVATAFQKDTNGHVVEVRRTGGWGHLIGDDGSSFHIGKLALQALLRSIEISESVDEIHLSEMEREILAYFGCTKNEVLSRLLYSGKNPKRDIGDLAKIVTRLAFRDKNPDTQALEILHSAASSLAQLIQPLIKTCPPISSLLILSGALMGLSEFRELIYEEFSSAHIVDFKEIIVIQSVSDAVVELLAARAI
ncbi:uncharacterized protein N7443_003983 [Penicillium atrosanguineum]|uniref:uncharacterized protein n=1 Tax=Penicillium atrosanguineum TaxID=1132637 RepID=UPI0023A4258C|nr:uncharacterized protein N7443_003983 [Penicillium atrosanguineum]KAJ5304323.1 hypothetical protein N7443_003983 [Penicillium atrosanguineum]